MTSLIMRWIEEVFAYGWAYGSTGDKLKNKKIIFGITAGAADKEYRNGSSPVQADNIINFVKGIASFCNMNCLGVKFTGGLLSDNGALSDEGKKAVIEHVDFIVSKI